MILTVIGSGTAVPSVERGAPCLHLAAGGRSLVFDLGSGSVRQLWKKGIDVRLIDVLALSHFHPDHTADLVPLLFALANPEFGRDGEMLLVGPAGLTKYVTDLERIYGDWIRPPSLRRSGEFGKADVMHATLNNRMLDTQQFGDARSHVTILI